MNFDFSWSYCLTVDMRCFHVADGTGNPPIDVHNAAISTMTRNRFEELMSYVYVADNENLVEIDRFAKVQPLFTALNKKILDSFHVRKTS